MDKPVTVTVAFVTDGAEGIETLQLTQPVLVAGVDSDGVLVEDSSGAYLSCEIIDAVVKAWQKLSADRA